MRDLSLLTTQFGFVGDIDASVGARQRYATDASVYEQLPVAVVFPRHTADVQALVRFCQQQGLSVTARGAGTSLAGQAIGSGVVMDMTRYFNRILDIDPQAQTVTVETGVVLDDLNRQLKAHGLWLALDTSTANRCVVGGIVGNNSCGAYSVAFGTPRDQIMSVIAILADASEVVFESLSFDAYQQKSALTALEGIIYQEVDALLSQHAQEVIAAFPDASIIRRNTGYALDVLAQQPRWSGGGEANLAPLICGSEGTLAIVTQATFKLSLLPKYRALYVFHFNDVFSALDATPALLATGAVAVELIDAPTLAGTKGHTGFEQYRFWLQGEPEAVQVVEYFADSEAALDAKLQQAEQLTQTLAGVYAGIAVAGQQMSAVWEVRKAGLGLLMGKVGAKKAVAVIEDAAVPIRHLSAFMRDIRALMAELSVNCIYYGHASVGLIHLRPELDLSDAQDKALFVQIAQRVSGLVKQYKGALSGEHGDGRLRAPFLRQQLGDAVYGYLWQVKRAFDSSGLLNPGKVLSEVPIDQNWRVPVLSQLQTGLDWQSELGFAKSVEKCNGAGACRKTTGAMCPSFQATQEDAYSTRGRANLLRFALQSPDPVAAMAVDELQDALSLCLGCKACKSECPAGVDMTRLKSEVLYQVHGGEAKTVKRWLYRHYAKLLPWLNRMRAIVPTLNHVAGLRKLPQADAGDLRSWWQTIGQASNPHSGKTVVVWVDVYTRWLHPLQGRATIRVLQTLGFNVHPIWLGDSPRLLISQGFLAQAKACLVNGLAQLPNEAIWGLIGIEPSELLVLRDDGLALLSQQQQLPLQALTGRVWLFEEAMVAFSAQHPDYQWPALEQPITVHVHCHQKSLAGVASSQHAFALLGRQVSIVDAGCCGMAGSFGYDQSELSVTIANKALLPALEQMAEDALLVSAGTSCQQQISDLSDKQGLHPAQVFAQAMVLV
jgi:FAD/FMN-containing dehydrogenase/Fe-S oxidoreductase